ncbi:MAG: DUF4349 domain-containing protein [Eubacteriales bacterium]|jgi:hypothetical protein|nr:DUF4349 domain-containing protein [Eubacteriales bacterium]MDD4104501.1 DUF4349 domain-containing protein [Eubacteriales bacterium]NLO14999.1 DUF4349 domain-containing protein [Clostridiales bacterium]
MNCSEFRALLEENVKAGKLSAQQLEHLEGCRDCLFAYTYLKDCRTLDEGSEVPDSFKASWRQAIIKEALPMQTKPWFNARSKKWLALAAALIVLFGGTALTKDFLDPPSQNKSAVQGGEDYHLPQNYPAPAAGGARGVEDAGIMWSEAEQSALASPPVATAKTGAKIIRTISVTLSTREFEKDLDALRAALADINGYVEYSDISTESNFSRYATLTLRIPKDHVDAFMLEVEGIGRSVAVSESSQDVSDQYTDVATRLQTQKTKMERLQVMLKQAVSIEELLQIEDSIADTQYQIDSLSGTLQGLDSKVDYATVNVYLKEELDADIVDIKDATLGDRILSALKTMWTSVQTLLSDMVVFIIVMMPFILIASVVIILARWFIKKRRNKNEKT